MQFAEKAAKKGGDRVRLSDVASRNLRRILEVTNLD
jgi:hypothetical protein